MALTFNSIFYMVQSQSRRNCTISISIRSFIYKIWVKPAAGLKDFHMLLVYVFHREKFGFPTTHNDTQEPRWKLIYHIHSSAAKYCACFPLSRKDIHFPSCMEQTLSPTTLMYMYIHFAANNTRVCTIRDRQENQPR